MNQWQFPFRTLLASLIFSLVLVLGLGAAGAQPSPPFGGGAGSHYGGVAAISEPAAQSCSLHSCAVQVAGCCQGMIDGGCFGAIASAALSAAAPAGLVPAAWIALPANSLAGLGPRTDRRPPRVAI